MAKANGGAPGVDHQAFEGIGTAGLEEWLAGVRAELIAGTYRPQPVRRVMIPKPGGGERPLGIPTIRDRVVQTAAKLVMEPIFEADLERNAYGYRPKRSAQDAVRKVHKLLCLGYTDVVDADLSKYFDTIPHRICEQPSRMKGLSPIQPVASRVFQLRANAEPLANPFDRIVDLTMLVGSEIQNVDLFLSAGERRENRVQTILHVQVGLALPSLPRDPQAPEGRGAACRSRRRGRASSARREWRRSGRSTQHLGELPGTADRDQDVAGWATFAACGKGLHLTGTLGVLDLATEIREGSLLFRQRGAVKLAALKQLELF
jgi:hypothetical protein